jgi:hypothetical protein
MKAKFMGIFGGFILAALVLVAPLTASAQSGPFTADVNIVSVTQDETLLEVRASNVLPAGFQNARFVILNTDTEQKSQLAIMLTALSTGKQVRITFTTNNPAPNQNIITRVQLTN